LGKVSIIVVNYNGKRLLSGCLDGLRQQVYQPLSITLVDNGSSDGSTDFLTRNYPEVTVIALHENLGFAVANNIALREARTEYVALLNNDVVPSPRWLKALIAALDNHPEAGFAASKMIFSDRPGLIDRVGDTYTTAGAGHLRGRGRSSAQYDSHEWVFGACAGAALYRTAMLNDVGPFDEDFFLLYEDVDLSFRAQLKGYKCIYVPDAVAYHRASSSIVYDSPTSVYYGHRNLEWTYVKNMPHRLLIRTFWLHIIYDIVALLFFAAKGRIVDFLKAKRDALRGLSKMLGKRRQIQKIRTVSNGYIWDLFEKELFFPRLSRRMRGIDSAVGHGKDTRDGY
jgi:GT2 family glycosyltransferase